MSNADVSKSEDEALATDVKVIDNAKLTRQKKSKRQKVTNYVVLRKNKV